MAIGPLNYTSTLFNQTHYQQYVQHRFDTLTALGRVGPQSSMATLVRFNQTFSQLKFPTPIPPTQAYQIWGRRQKETENQSNSNLLQQSEIIALLRRGIEPSDNFKPLHQQVIRLRNYTREGAEDSISRPSMLASRAPSFENGIFANQSPTFTQAFDQRREDNQILHTIRILSHFVALSIIYYISKTFLETFFGTQK